MITGKQRSELKKMAQEIKPTVMIGKEEVTPNVIASIDDYLAAHELIKVQIQDGAILDPKETANEIAEELGLQVDLSGSSPVQRRLLTKDFLFHKGNR